MSRERAIADVHAQFDDGTFERALARRVAIPTESQNPDRAPDLRRYLSDEMVPAFAAMGFATRIVEHASGWPFLIAERLEDDSFPTVLGYGHGDTVRGMEGSWSDGLSPWVLSARHERWYGRGVVDNKGQHLINMLAQAAVIKARGRLGFNAKWIIEMGEETGSPGLRALCEENRAALKADLLIASDGPRHAIDMPTVFLGARGAFLIDLIVEHRAGGHHSGNWGGLLANPGIQLAHAIAALVGPSGQIRVPDLVPRGGIPANVRATLAALPLESGPDDPVIDPDWGEPGLSAAEKVFGWCSFEVLAYETGNPKAPVNAIPPRAFARCQLRHVVGVDPEAIIPAIRAHLDRAGLAMVRVETGREDNFPATRLDLDHPAVAFAVASVAKTTGKQVALLPNLGGSLPNDVFCDLLGLPTIWVPHSYRGCSQHAPDEHVPKALFREALGVMAGLYWDLGEVGRGALKA